MVCSKFKFSSSELNALPIRCPNKENIMPEPPKRRWKPPKNETRSSGRRVSERKVKAFNAKTESAKRWLERQFSDPYVKRAYEEGYRSRAAYKLKGIDERTKILKNRKRIVDLGCAPGSWIQVCLEQHATESIVGIDLLPIEPIPQVDIQVGDVTNPIDMEILLEKLSGKPDLILSDMAANTTGHRATDHLRTIVLAEKALEIAIANLETGGAFCTKVFEGGASKEMLQTLKDEFNFVKHVKPPASRANSAEIYVIAKGFRTTVN